MQFQLGEYYSSGTPLHPERRGAQMQFQLGEYYLQLRNAAAPEASLCYPQNSRCSPVQTPAITTTITRCAGLLRPERTSNQDSDFPRPAAAGGHSHFMEDFN